MAATRPDGVPSRPRLNPALRRLWRDTGTLQLGTDPQRALIVDGLEPAALQFLQTLDGTRTEAEVLADAAAVDIDVGTMTQLLVGLARGSALLDGPGGSVEDRLAPDLAALSLLTAHPAERMLQRRSHLSVVVHGGGRVGAPLAALLASSGVGVVTVVDDEVVSAAACAPGGFTAAEIDRPTRVAAPDVVRRAAPRADPGPFPPERMPDLTILATAYPIEDSVRGPLQAAGLPHLIAGVRETTAVVGPLVLPGRTSCLTCADLHRGDRDPDWPLLSLQLTGGPRRTPAAADMALALTTAGMAGTQALAFLDGRPTAVEEATLELVQPDWRIRRRPWPVHPQCRCTDGPTTHPVLRAG